MQCNNEVFHTKAICNGLQQQMRESAWNKEWHTENMVPLLRCTAHRMLDGKRYSFLMVLLPPMVVLLFFVMWSHSSMKNMLMIKACILHVPYKPRIQSILAWRTDRTGEWQKAKIKSTTWVRVGQNTRRGIIRCAVYCGSVWSTSLSTVRWTAAHIGGKSPLTLPLLLLLMLLHSMDGDAAGAVLSCVVLNVT